MTGSPTPQEAEIAGVAASLSEQERSIARSLCGNAWTGARPSPGILVMNGLELMHIDALKGHDGSWVHFKARPTPLGVMVYAHLQRTQGESQARAKETPDAE